MGLCLLVSSNKSSADGVKLLGRLQDLSLSATPLSKAAGREGLWAFLTLQRSWVEPDWICIWDHTDKPEGFCKIVLLSIATGQQWQGIKASGPSPVISTPLLQSVQVELQPHGAAQGQKDLERDLRGAQQHCSSGSWGSRRCWQPSFPRAPFPA